MPKLRGGAKRSYKVGLFGGFFIGVIIFAFGHKCLIFKPEPLLFEWLSISIANLIIFFSVIIGIIGLFNLTKRYVINPVTDGCILGIASVFEIYFIYQKIIEFLKVTLPIIW